MLELGVADLQLLGQILVAPLQPPDAVVRGVHLVLGGGQFLLQLLDARPDPLDLGLVLLGTSRGVRQLGLLLGQHLLQLGLRVLEIGQLLVALEQLELQLLRVGVATGDGPGPTAVLELLLVAQRAAQLLVLALEGDLFGLEALALAPLGCVLGLELFELSGRERERARGCLGAGELSLQGIFSRESRYEIWWEKCSDTIGV